MNPNGNLDSLPTLSKPSKPLAPTAISTYKDSQRRVAEIASRATLNDPLNVLFQREKTSPLTPVTAMQLYGACMACISRRIAAGAFVVEAAGFAAVACWELPQSTPPDLPEETIDKLFAREGRPIYAPFLRDLQVARCEVLGSHTRFWSLSSMARDPNRKAKGAVRAVIQLLVARARAESLPLWLVAANERARDVYAYFGFRVVKVPEEFC
ncbi:hypothetical protein VPNG_00995 [Cytospora leucostoma]|uniref:N-acetyltransferase domain-containing protein n=1 Tax=Cytospora leucostoma TaxID=1230097 RepID=A0A423XM90_9PEZI|nr:hypothetical protein VPNG_00995 [Cytospora leucostoma]